MQSNNKVKTVLILAFFYPPENAIGATRLSKFSKYLLKHGIKPIVVTPKKYNLNHPVQPEIPEELIHYVDWYDTSKHIQKLYASKNPLLHFFGQVLFKIIPGSPGRWPEIRSRFWRKPALKKALEIISKEKVDIILSTVSPPAALFIAEELKKKTSIPWVADYRDPWSFNPYFKKRPLLDWIDRYQEKRLLKNVDAIITVSSALKEMFVNFAGKNTYVVYNGFDSVKKKQFMKGDRLTIIHTGAIYKGKRDPSPLFKAVNLLQKKGVDTGKLHIQFYGGNVKIIRELVNNYGLNDMIELKNLVSREEIEKIQQSAGILLLLTWNNKVAKGTLTGKLFEYLGVRRPILAIAYPGEIKRILEKTKTGVLLNHPEEIADFLEKSLSMHQRKPDLGFEFDDTEINFYSRENQTVRLEEVLNSVVV